MPAWTPRTFPMRYQQDDTRLLDASWFCARIEELGGTTPESYRFVEIEQDRTTNLPVEKEGGVYNTLPASPGGTDASPAYAIDGGTYAVDDIVFVRRSQSALPNWDIRGPGMPGLTTWGADYRTATVPFPGATVPSDPLSFDETSSLSVLTVLQDTIVEIPDDIDSVIIFANLRLGAAVTGADIFPDGYSRFSVLAYIVLLGDDCEPEPGGGAFLVVSFDGSASGPINHVAVAGQLLHDSGSTLAAFGNYTTTGGGHWVGDTPAFGIIDAASCRDDYGVAKCRLAWAVSAPTVSNFPATWEMTYYPSTRPLTYLEWERRGEPTNTVIGCGSGSSEGGCCDDELVDHPNLNVNIPDGSNAGDYSAAWNGSLWRVIIGDSIAVISCSDGIWTLNGRVADTQACDPLLVTFGGADFGSTGDITVTVE